MKSIVVDLPLEDPPSVDQAREILSQMEADLADHAEADGYGMGKTRRGLVAWAKRIAELSEAGATGLTVSDLAEVADRAGGDFTCLLSLDENDTYFDLHFK